MFTMYPQYVLHYVPVAAMVVARYAEVLIVFKTNIALTPSLLQQLTAIEGHSDRPRANIIRRSISEYIDKYRKANPEFAAANPMVREVSEQILKPGVKTDFVIAGGRKTLVVVTPGGWRLPTSEDYESDGEAVSSSILD